LWEGGRKPLAFVRAPDDTQGQEAKACEGERIENQKGRQKGREEVGEEIQEEEGKGEEIAYRR
jgi:hypothetical protein